MSELLHNNTYLQTPAGLIVVSPETNLASIDFDHITTMLEAATMSAIDGALHTGTDMPVGAATSRDGKIISVNYAQDNLMRNPNAHAEYMAMQLAHEKHPGVQPDTIAVTLEPCIMCQNYLAEFPSLKVVAFALPLASAAVRRIIRPKECTIFDRHQHDPLPYNIVQLGNNRLTKLGNALLDSTLRNPETGETAINVDHLRRELNQHM